MHQNLTNDTSTALLLTLNGLADLIQKLLYSQFHYAALDNFKVIPL